MVSRIIIAFCTVAAAVGLLLVGMATSYLHRDESMFRLGLILMIGGVAGAIVGFFWYHAEESAALKQQAAQRVQSGQ